MLLKKEDMCVNKFDIKTNELFDCQIPFLKELFENNEFPWQILPKIKEIIEFHLQNGLEGYHKFSDTVLIGEGVSIAKTATIVGPAIIGNNVEIRPGAYIRSNVIIGDKCVIGNSTELKNVILLEHVQVPHYNYVGDSILGNHSHMGAGSICSNLRSDNKSVIIHADKDYPTELRKVGSFIGDYADIGCGSVLNPGTIIGKATQVYPLTMTRGAYPSNSIVKSTKTFCLKIVK